MRAPRLAPRAVERERRPRASPRDPAGTWGAPWLVEHLSAHAWLAGGAILLGAVFSGGLAMLILVGAARRLATGLTERPRLREAEQPRLSTVLEPTVNPFRCLLIAS